MKPPIPHPSRLIPAEYTEAINQLSGEAERSGVLHPDQLAILYEQKWFKLFVPRAFGGLELSLPEALAMEEGLAWADGSTGWTVTLCAGANWFIGFLQPELAGHLFQDHRVCLAGSGRPSGIATITSGGYEISGRWRYATGAPQATAFTANCRIEKDGVFLKGEDGQPLVRAFLFLREEVIIREDWNAMGMIATASHTFDVQRLSVPVNRCFRIEEGAAYLPQRIYRYPFLQLAETTLAVNSSGMAVRFIDLAAALLIETAPQRVEESRRTLEEARQSFYAAVRISWDEPGSAPEKGSESFAAPGSPIWEAVSEASRRLAASARRSVDELYPWCGLGAADRDTEMNRVWRNLHTASQHSLLTWKA